MMKHSVVLLTVKKPPKQPQPRLRVKTPPPVTVPQVPVKTHTDFVVHGYHSRVYADGESFELSVNLESHIVEPSFSAEIQWYYMNTSSSSCDLFRVFETCIFHPTAMACLHPEQHTCSFTSPSERPRSYTGCMETAAIMEIRGLLGAIALCWAIVYTLFNQHRTEWTCCSKTLPRRLPGCMCLYYCTTDIRRRGRIRCCQPQITL